MAGLFRADGEVEVLQASTFALRQHNLAGREAEGAGEQLRHGGVGGALNRRGRHPNAQDASRVDAFNGVPARSGRDANSDPAHDTSI